MLACFAACAERRTTFSSTQNGLALTVSVAHRNRGQEVTVVVKDQATSQPIRTAMVGVETSTLESQATNLHDGSYVAQMPPDDGINVVVSDSGRTAILQLK